MILNKLRKLGEGAKSGIFYTFSTLLTKGIIFLTIPIFTRIMTTSQIGVVNLYNSWFGLISVISTLSLTSGGYQLALKEFESEKDQYQSSVLSLTMLSALIFALLYFLNRGFWEKFLGMPRELVLLLVIGLIVSPAQEFWMARQRYDYKYKLSSIISISSTCIATMLSVFVVLNTDASETGTMRLICNNTVMYGVAAILAIYIFIKGKTFFSKKFWKFSLSLSIPLVGNSIAKQILDVSDRIMINEFIGTSAVGVYSTLYSISSLTLIVWNAINGAYVPYLFKNIDDKSEHENIRRSSSLILFLYTILAVFMMLLAPEIVRIIATEEYTEAIYIMPPIFMGVSLTAISNMYTNLLIYYKKTKIIMIASGIAAITNILLNALLIPTFGYEAAAYTTLFAYVIMSIILIVVATKAYKHINCCNEMLYSNSFIFKLCIFNVAMAFVSVSLYKTNLLRYLVCAFCFVAIIWAYFKKKK